MSVRLDETAIRLEGECHVEDAEALVAYVQAHPKLPVDLSQCRHLHSALAQALLAFRPVLTGVGADETLETWLRAPPRTDKSDAPMR